MSLVDYLSSDESDADVDCGSKNCTDTKNVFNAPISFVIPGKPKESVKISIPSLKEFEDDDDSEVLQKKAKRSASSGLIGILPPPKYARNSPGTFLPYALNKKSKTSFDLSKVPSSLNIHKTTSAKVPLDPQSNCQEKNCYSLHDTEDNQTSHQNFFSLEEPMVSAKDIDISQSFHNSNNVFVAEPSHHLTVGEASSNQDNTEFQITTEGSARFSSVQDINSGYGVIHEPSKSISSNDQYLTDEGFLRLQGKRRGQESINIIDVSADDQLTDTAKWLTKSLTEEKTHRPSMKKDQLPTQQQRRKHQITYLAFQAKEREQELRNQWSHNRLTKRETQAKYGF